MHSHVQRGNEKNVRYIMKKAFLYSIPLLSGILTGFILIIIAGIIYPPPEVFIWTTHTLKEHELSSSLQLTFGAIHLIHITSISIPLLTILGYFLSNIKMLEPSTMSWVSSLGIIVFFIPLGAINIVELIIEIATLAGLNLLIQMQISKYMVARQNA